jgi:hypothetical protein
MHPGEPLVERSCCPNGCKCILVCQLSFVKVRWRNSRLRKEHKPTSKLDLIDPVWQVSGLVAEDVRFQVVERVVVDAVGLMTEAAVLICKCQLETFNGVSEPTVACVGIHIVVPTRQPIAATVSMHADNSWVVASSLHRRIKVDNEGGLRTSVFGLRPTASLIPPRVDNLVFLVIEPIGIEDESSIEPLVAGEGDSFHLFVASPTADLLSGFDLADDNLGQMGQGLEDEGQQFAIPTIDDEILVRPIMVSVHHADFVHHFLVFEGEPGIHTQRKGELFPAPLVTVLVHPQSLCNNCHTLDQGEHRGRTASEKSNVCHKTLIPWLDSRMVADIRYKGVVKGCMYGLGCRAEAEKIVPLEATTDILKDF